MRFIGFALLVALPFCGQGTSAAAAPLQSGPTDVSAQSRRAEARAPARIIVRPRYPGRTFNSPYPLPYRTEYPGPGATRECVARYVQEARLSGTVIVPRMYCWWQPG